MLQKLSDGALDFHSKIPEAKNIRGEGWELTSSGSRFAMLNGVLIKSSRKEIVDEVLASLADHNTPADIRLVGPGISQIGPLAERGYRNLGSAPFMMWVADNSVDDFKVRDSLTVRRLGKDDLEVMCAIYMDVYKFSDEVIKDYKRMPFASINDHTYGLFLENEMVSVVTAMVYEDTVGIWSMGTPTSHQKNGYGRELLMNVMKSHKDMGAKFFFLHASAAGKFLYDKCGWITLDYLPYLSKA